MITAMSRVCQKNIGDFYQVLNDARIMYVFFKVMNVHTKTNKNVIY